MKPLHALMAASLAASAWFAWFGDKTPQADIAELPTRTRQAVEAPRQAGQASVNQAAKMPASAILALKPRTGLIGESDSAARGDLFARQTWGAPPPPLAKALAAPAVAAPAPVLTYVGKKQEDGVWEVYLSQQDQLYIVKDKTVIDGKYRVDSIVPPKLMLTYLPSSQQQTVMIGEAQ